MAIGSVNAVKLTASSRIATASAWVRGAKLDRNVPGVAMSRSGHRVVPAVDGVVGSLEEQVLAVLDELVRAIRVQRPTGRRERPWMP